ncbi:MAG: phosphate butyryltransferase [Hungatella sp.]|nr:phosphate butyryltransferase [Hungatella sp.]
MKTFDEVFEKVKGKGGRRIAVAAAADEPVLEAVRDAVSMGLAQADLVGDKEKIKAIAAKINFDLHQVNLYDEPDEKEAARKAVTLVHDGKASVLMKGLISTADFLRAVLNKETGLRTGKTLSSVSVMKSPQIDRFILMTDGGMVMYPGLEEKVQILENVIPVCRALEIENPKAAAVCAVEVVNPAMQATLDGASLALMSQRGQIKGIMVDGPLGLDNALSEEAARHKGLKGEVAGKADVILVPDIEAGNIMYKSLVYMGNTETAALIMGAAAPIIMTSRADAPKTKLNSLAVALLI